MSVGQHRVTAKSSLRKSVLALALVLGALAIFQAGLAVRLSGHFTGLWLDQTREFTALHAISEEVLDEGVQVGAQAKRAEAAAGVQQAIASARQGGLILGGLTALLGILGGLWLYRQAISAHEYTRMFQSLISHAPFSVWMCNGEGTITFVNQAALDLFGVTDPAQVVGRYNIYRDSTEAEKPLLAHFERAWEGEVVRYRQDLDMTTVKYETTRRETLHFHSTLFTIPAGEGRRPNLVVVQEDVTERERAELELATLYEVAQGIAAAVELPELIQRVYQGCQQILPVDTFYLALYDPESQTVQVPVYIENGEDLGPLCFPLVEAGLTGYIIRSGQPLLIGDYATEVEHLPVEPRFVGAERQHFSYLGVPLMSEKQVVGVLSVQRLSHGSTVNRSERSSNGWGSRWPWR